MWRWQCKTRQLQRKITRLDTHSVACCQFVDQHSKKIFLSKTSSTRSRTWCSYETPGNIKSSLLAEEKTMNGLTAATRPRFMTRARERGARWARATCSNKTRSAQIYDCGRGECQKPQYSSPPNGVLFAGTQFKGSHHELRRETKRNLHEAEGTLESTHSSEEVTYTISQFQCDDSYRLSLKGKVQVVDEEIPLDGCHHPSLLACNGFILLPADKSPALQWWWSGGAAPSHEAL